VTLSRAKPDVAFLLAQQARGGAFPACPAFSQYPYCWLRDGTFTAYALDLSGEHGAARRFYRWAAGVTASLEPQVSDLIARRGAGLPISENAFLPTRFALEGTALGDGWPNFQLDGYGQWLWGLGEHLALAGERAIPPEFQNGVEVTLRYLKHFWDEGCYDCWEEFPFRWHTSTLASLYGGVRAMARFDPTLEPLAARIRAFTLEHCVQNGAFVKFAGYPVPDGSLLWTAVPFGLVDVQDPMFLETVTQIETRLWRGAGVHRYEHDTYFGGGGWVLLSAWLGWVYARLGRIGDAARLAEWVRAQDDGGGLPEQTSASLLCPPYLEAWRARWGASAKPLLWSHAMLIVLEHELTRIKGRA
jgi:GH15 family glucan-1,4-alpha-glucosidase